jgi:hypothetical protein
LAASTPDSRLFLQRKPYLYCLHNCMRKILAILLLGVHLFNLGGYRLVFSNLESKMGTQMVAKLDRSDYDDKDLIEVKVPVNLPYQTNWQDFERYDGEIQIAGVHYNYVKRKLQNDTLILMCIPNTDKMKLFNARETFFSLVNDMQQTETGKNLPLPVKPVKIFMAEYVPDQNDFSFAGPQIPVIEYSHIKSPEIHTVYYPTASQPPELIA